MSAIQNAYRSSMSCARIDGRESPVLSLRRVAIGWRAHGDAAQKEMPEGPDIRAVGRGADGEILIEADAESGLVRERGGGGDLAIELELEPAVEVDRVRVGCAKGDDIRGGGVTILRWPVRPAAQLAPGRKVIFERAEGGEVHERRALLLDVRAVVAAAAGARIAVANDEGAMEHLERAALELPRAIVVDVGARAQRDERGLRGGIVEERARVGALVELRHRGDIDVDRVAIEPAHGAVRRDVVASIAERVERVHPDEGRALRATPLRDGAEIRNVAHAPVGVAAHGVEVRDDSHRAANRRHAFWRNDDQRLRLVANGERVVADREILPLDPHTAALEGEHRAARRKGERSVVDDHAHRRESARALACIEQSRARWRRALRRMHRSPSRR